MDTETYNKYFEETFFFFFKFQTETKHKEDFPLSAKIFSMVEPSSCAFVSQVESTTAVRHSSLTWWVREYLQFLVGPGFCHAWAYLALIRFINWYNSYKVRPMQPLCKYTNLSQKCTAQTRTCISPSGGDYTLVPDKNNPDKKIHNNNKRYYSFLILSVFWQISIS